MAKDCNCNKPSPLGRPQPGGSQQPKSLVASQGSQGIVHVSPSGIRTKKDDLIAARAAVIRFGGTIENG